MTCPFERIAATVTSVGGSVELGGGIGIVKFSAGKKLDKIRRCVSTSSISIVGTSYKNGETGMLTEVLKLMVASTK